MVNIWSRWITKYQRFVSVQRKIYSRLKQFTSFVLLSFISSLALASTADSIDIPFQHFQLENGLTLIVHEDHKAPVVSVNIWYHVGSKDERPGITGFAHLFEHLMFNGSENYNDDWFLPLQKAGGTDLNGTTWFDRTNYFQTVPTPALDMVLWMESDRMGHFIEAVTQERLDEQRDVVKNEKRQGDNRPYAKAEYAQLKGMFPVGHPYRWSTIGSLDDLNAASLDDVKQWFAKYYGAANATLVVAGDVDSDEVLKKVKHYFADIPAGPPITRTERWVAQRSESSRDVMYDNVPQVRLSRSWNTAPFGEHDAAVLELAAAVIGQGKNSRLYQRLVYEEQIASSVTSSQSAFEIAGMFEIEVYLKPSTTIAEVEAIIDQELNRFLRKGPTKKELQRVKNKLLARGIRGLEKVGGFSGKSHTLAKYQTYLGEASLYKRHLTWLEEASRTDLLEVSRRWLSSGDYNLEIHPQRVFVASEVGADRSSLPDPGEVPELSLPAIEEYRLSNGLRVVQMQRASVPVTEFTMQFEAGYAKDPRSKLGLAAITAEMIDEGTPELNAIRIAEQMETLGAKISTRAALDASFVSLSALDQHLDASLALFSGIVRQPTFPEDEFKRVKSNWLDKITKEQSSPFATALRRLPPLLYGSDHPYGIPFTGSGFANTVKALKRQDLLDFHAANFAPENATLIVVGSTPKQTLLPLLERYFSNWQASSEKSGQALVNNSSDVATINSSQRPIYLIDKPGAPQSLILGGQLVPPSSWADSYKLEMASKVLGGSFTSRINMNLREDKGWSYGARTLLPETRGQRPLMYYAPVQQDKTAESLAELIRETNEFAGTHPASEEELNRFSAAEIRSLPGKYETNGAVMDTLSDIVMLERPLDYIQSNQTLIASLSTETVAETAREYINSEKILWLIVGDVEKIRGPLEKLGLGEIVILKE